MATFPSRLTSKLIAVNMLLRSIGESPVNDLEVSEAVDVANAEATLDEISLAVQSDGWSWNREKNFTLSVNSDGEIPLPDMCLTVTKAYWPDSSGMPINEEIVERARKLYDKSNHTYTFDKNVMVDMLVFLDWEEMPELARRYITVRAAKLFQGNFQGSAAVDRVTEDEVARARQALLNVEDQADPSNSISDNVDVQRRLGGRGVRRNR